MLINMSACGAKQMKLYSNKSYMRNVVDANITAFLFFEVIRNKLSVIVMNDIIKINKIYRSEKARCF